ncbi:MAG: NAD(P)H-hydrate dehydratase [Nevskiaceae bacterium]|nr:MAG: NAD(P)H-hydrate dehydratase [Nevskiaceae bacterium]
MTMEFRKLYSAAQVREMDRLAIAGGLAGYVLMQRAAQASWQALQQRPPSRRIDVVCGEGNNGGDGYEIARIARRAGHEVRVWHVGATPVRGDAHTAWRAWRDDGGITAALRADSLEGAKTVVDALFGIGLARDLSGAALEAVNSINAARRRGAWVLAVDVPSGLDSDTGRIRGEAVQAEVTVTFIGRKLGLYTGAGVDCAGQVVFDDLGLPQHVGEDRADLLSRENLAAWLPPRARDTHKGRNGHVLILGGDVGMAGAALLAGRAALRAGAGLVSLATHPAHAATLTAAQPELMCHGVSSPRDLAPLLERATVIAAGPGLGQGPWARPLLSGIWESRGPLVVDADALNLLAEEPLRRDDWVLTPHPGEAARLLHVSTRAIQDDRPAAVARLRERYGGVVVLKGAGTLVQGERLALCSAGNPGMAVGGMGDVLTGVIAAMAAQGLPCEAAARAGVLAHALAGDAAAVAGQRGLLPSDLLASLREIVNP